MISIDTMKKIKNSYELFTDDIDEIKIKYVELMKLYHPALNGNRKEYTEIIEKINTLYKIAEGDIMRGVWKKPGFIKLRCIDEEDYEINFKIKHEFELGDMYIGEDSILYLIKSEYEKLAFNAINKMNNIKYNNSDMKTEFNRCLPSIKRNFETISGDIGIVIEKDKDLILVKDLLTYCNGRLSVNIVGWILNSLYNIICFTNFNGLTHNGIRIDNYFVSVKNKYGALLGGWWYSVNKKETNTINDLESVRSLGRKLLGDEKGIILSMDREISRDLLGWIGEKSSDNPFEEYYFWSKISNKIEEKYIKPVIINNDDLYEKLNKN